MKKAVASLLAVSLLVLTAWAGNVPVKDGAGSDAYLKATGAGSDVDPYIPIHAATQSGTWTVQPGNTANTTAWKVDGSAVTQPVSASSLPLPTGAATAAKQPALGAAGTASSDVITVQGITSMTPLKVDGSAVVQPISDNSGSITVDNGGTFAVQAAQSGTWNVTNVSGTVSLPTGASTAAKQPALGTAGSSSADVISVQGVASMTPLTTGGISKLISSSITRPSDTTAYAAGDAVTNSTSSPVVVTFSNMCRVSGGSGVIVGASLIDSANQSTKGDFELYLFDTTFTPDNDNAVFTPTDSELETALGFISFSSSFAKSGDATSGASGNAMYASSMSNPIPYVCGTTSVFGGLVVRNAYTPVSAEKFTIRLQIQQD